MAYLLDTDTCIYILKSVNVELIAKVKQHQNHLYTSSIVLHELYYGAQSYAQPDARRHLIDVLISQFKILDIDSRVAEIAGEIRYALKRRGEMIGPYDLLIGATALAHNITLVTGNQREFSRLPGLKTESWIF